VLLLILGLVAVATDAQALACEVSCAKGMEHGSTQVSPDQYGMNLGHKHSTVHHHGEGPHPGAAAPHLQVNGAPPSVSHAEGHFGSEMAKCVAVDQISLAAVAPQSFHPVVVLAPFAQSVIELALEDGHNPTSGAESPPARNGPITFSSILRI
jgi:hypothetical protein